MKVQSIFMLGLVIAFQSAVVAQKPVNYLVERLPGTINSEFEESKPITSPNGDSLYFARSFNPSNRGGELSGEDIWFSNRNEVSEWLLATNQLGQLNDTHSNTAIGYVFEKKALYTVRYLMSAGHRQALICKTHNRMGKWSYPEGIGVPPLIVGDDYNDFYMHPAEDVLVISMRALNTIGKEDLYVSIKGENGIWSNPIHLGIVINTKNFEISPFMSRDKRQLYFASDGHEGLGNADIFRSTRKGDSWVDWSEPENLGSPINSSAFDAYLFINESEELFFCSNRGKEYTDIFRAKGISSEPAQMPEPALPDGEGGEDGLLLTEIGMAENPVEVFFGFNESKLDYFGKIKLDGIAAEIGDNFSGSIDIVGYTDEVGSENYNMKLSEKRAKSVYKYLQKNLTSQAALSYSGKGVFTDRSVSAERMRRVDLFIRK